MPAETNLEPPSGPSCFMDQFRVCGPDCAAYDLEGASAGAVHAPQHCGILLAARALVLSTRNMSQSLKQIELALADRKAT